MAYNEMLNLGIVLANELQVQMIPNVQLYRTGNMRANGKVVTIEESYVDVVIATDYALYTNSRGRMAGWIDRVVDKVCRAYAENNAVDNSNISGMISYE